MKQNNSKGIRAAQRKELLFIFYYLIYTLDFFEGFWYTLDKNRAKAFVRFNKEIADKEDTQEYLKYRKRFAWRKY